jgi:hypothetical protein
MKISTLVVFLLSGVLTLQAKQPASTFGTDNIVLKNFQAIPIATGAKVVWEFTSEEKDVTCNLEKSIDGVNFVVLTTIILPSTRTQSLHSFIDKEAAGQVFYRLRVTKDSYIPYISPIVSLTIAKYTAAAPQAGPITAMVKSSFFGELTAQNDMMSLQLVDLNGHAKINKSVRGPGLEGNFKPSFSRLPSGYYVLRVNDMQNNTLLNRFIYKF